MALKIKLMRMGKKKQPSYRVVIKEARSPRSGRFVELVGTYAPLEDPTAVKLNEERISYWMSVGAKPTETVQRLIKEHTAIKV